MAGLVALLQLNPIVGDIEFNVAEIERASALAATKGAVLAWTSELAVCGYPPRDLLLEEGFVNRCQDAASAVQSPIPTLVGTPIDSGSERTKPANGAVRVGPDGSSEVVCRKQLLPTYDVFDEARYFEGNHDAGLANAAGMHLGVTICEDAWQHVGDVPSDYLTDPIEQLAEWQQSDGPLNLTVNLSASPYHLAKEGGRATLARAAAGTLGHPFALCNQVGGNDDLVFDGRSVVAWPNGVVVQAPGWCSGILLFEIGNPASSEWIPLATATPHDGCDCNCQIVEDGFPQVPEAGSDLLCAVTCGLRDYCRKSGIRSLVLGMSGGIDSAVCTAIAARAIGPENVLGLSMPSKHSSKHSIDDAIATARALEIELLSMPINELHEEAEETLAAELEGGNPVAAENLQARIRGMLVMGAANARGSMAVATGNKSELAVGYCTLYGDMNGGYAPLGDLYKTQVYELAEAINEDAKSSGRPLPITASTMAKPPSAELSPGQVDQDTLPPYDILDEILRALIEDGASPERVVSAGHDQSMVSWVGEHLEASEHKRWQMPPAPRVSERAFGQGWRQPLAVKR
jgi:NAD+ synthetase